MGRANTSARQDPAMLQRTCNTLLNTCNNKISRIVLRNIIQKVLQPGEIT